MISDRYKEQPARQTGQGFHVHRMNLECLFPHSISTIVRSPITARSGSAYFFFDHVDVIPPGIHGAGQARRYFIFLFVFFFSSFLVFFFLPFQNMLRTTNTMPAA
ncbi:uncharacterized protein BDV17DRAFT_181932 [Aspergillus undulatus]|uniref:uncharacterized protein n=1 Tax=Aspergillus undulatus TaxID=1810928 RepID=UPI003CCCD6C6